MQVRLPFGLVSIVAALILAGCSGEPATKQGPTVLAASSMQEALTEVAEKWAEDGNQTPRLSFAASSALARQIEGGAPADIFLSADEEWMDWLEEKRALRPETRADLLANELVLVTPQSAPTKGLALLKSGRVAMADPEVVPAGRYAQAALESLGLWDEIKPRVVPAENVRAALVLVERGEVPFGVVYATDAKASNRVAITFRFPSGSHPPIRYPASVLATSDHPDASEFHAFLFSEEAQKIFERHGFGLAPGDAR